MTTPSYPAVKDLALAPRLERARSTLFEVQRQARPLLRLLGYVRGHSRYALLTVIFGTAGFLLSFVYPWIIGSAIDLVAAPAQSAFAMSERASRLWRLTQLAALTGLAHAVVVYGRGHFNVHLGDSIVTDLRRELFDHLQKLSVGFYTKQRTGSILSRILHDVCGATAIIYGGIIVAWMDATQLVVAAVLLTAISWKLTLACAAMFPLYGLVFLKLNPKVREASDRLHDHFSEISGNVSEKLSGQALIKTFTAEDREAQRFAEDARTHHGLVLQQSHLGHMVAAYGEVLVHTGTTIIVGYGTWLALRGELTVGLLTRFLGYIVILYGPVRRFAELNITYQSSLSAMRRVFRVFEITPAVRDNPGACEAPPSLGDVRFEDVRFRYGNDETAVALDDEGRVSLPPTGGWVLDGVTLHASPGERVAVVGPSGAGKTTLLSLLPRLHEVTAGKILVDGRDVRDYSLRALRSAIAVVQQDSFVFSGTIYENILYGREGASKDEVIAAARAAHAHDFILRFPKGYETRLGERGVNLSGGQRQRLSIARALLKDPRILILDEATSSLDAESEAIVQAALERLMRGRTSFIIAHRLSTVRNADRILVIEDGKIVEQGSHAELLTRGEIYARLVKNQSAG